MIKKEVLLIVFLTFNALLFAQNPPLLDLIGDTIHSGLKIENVAEDGILIRNNINGATADGIQIENVLDDGIIILNAGDDGVVVFSSNDDGFFSSQSGDNGFYALNSGGDGIFVTGSAGQAGFFGGSISVTGTITKSAGTFKIDHPLDPENKYLSHSFVESPDMMNIYNGNVLLDENGEAQVELPEWFTALNKDYKYQLTCIGAFANVFISEKVKDNKFKIAGGIEGMEVSWMITGVRDDAYAKMYRTKVEEEKEEEFKGYYITPEAFKKSKEKGILHKKEKMKKTKSE